MKRKQFEPLEIDTFETSVFPLPKHSHTYYELIYILKGCGNHHINQIIFPYKAGDLYLVSPEDEHFFSIKKSTKFCFIKFNDSYFESNKHLAPDTITIASPIDIMRNSLLKEEKLTFDDPCRSILKKTVENIIDYNRFNKVSDSPIVFFQILALFGIIRESSAKFLKVSVDNSTYQKDDLISYIHKNIYYPERIRINSIAGHFNISGTYFGAYFKRNFDVSYLQYITAYKLKLLQRRIQSSKVTMKQIAYEFGFTDESHFTNYFKKQMKMSPRDFKQLYPM